MTTEPSGTDTDNGTKAKGAIEEILKKSSLISLALGLVITAALFFYDTRVTISFFTGFAIGILGQRFFFRSIIKGLSLSAEHAVIFTATRYFLKFVVSALILVAFIWKLHLNIVAIVGGYVLIHFVTTFFAINYCKDLTKKREDLKV